MTPAQLRADNYQSWELAVAKLRASWIADCGDPPISRREAWEWPKMLDARMQGKAA